MGRLFYPTTATNGEGNGSPLQYSCLENLMDSSLLGSSVHGVTRVGYDLATKPPPQPQSWYPHWDRKGKLLPLDLSFFLSPSDIVGLPKWLSVKESVCPAEILVWSLGQEDPLEWEVATHSSILAWEIPWTEEPSGLQSTGDQRVSPDGAVVKNPPADVGDAGDQSLLLGLGRSPWGGNGNPLQYSYLENFMDRGDWWATLHGVVELDTTEHACCAEITTDFKKFSIWPVNLW